MQHYVAPIDRALWRLAELGGQYAEATTAATRRQAWAAIEKGIAEARSLFSGAQISAEAAAAEATTTVAALRRELDRERKRASTMHTALGAVERAADAARRRAKEAEAERDAAKANRAKVMAVRQKVDTIRAKVEVERDAALAAFTELEAARAQLEAERDAARAVAVAALQHTPLSEVTVARPVDLSPWTPPPAAIVDDHEIDLTDEIALTDGDSRPEAIPRSLVERLEAEALAAPSASAVCFLHVGATLGHLLPEDLDSTLVADARVVRRAGRLAALLAVPDPDGEEQARRLRREGFRVEWTTETDPELTG